MSDVFISHDTADRELVLQLARQLEAAGISTWYYERDAVPGVPHTSQTGNAIAAAKATLLVVSFHSIRSYEVNTEVNWTYSEHKSFVPVLVGITWAQFAHEKKAWQQLIGLSAGIEATPDNLPMVVSKITEGLRQLELAVPATEPPLAPSGIPGSGPVQAPPSATAQSERKHNLPLQLTSFIGRERELVAIKGLLATTRLLTLTGVGGTGKTRLALEVGANCLQLYQGGVWLVELAALSDPALVPSAVASALALREQTGRPIRDTLLDYLREKTLLLILDNCEHLIEACAQLANEILQACPQIRILATSRESLGIAGETLYTVPSLSLPAEAGQRESLAASESGRLFAERARAVAPQFEVTAQNAAAITQICRRLDGIPLALELAAARVKVLAPDQIASRLDDRFRLLTGGNRAALERHQTLRAAVAWSYGLLAPAERLLLERVAFFDGGWTLEAAEAVCSGDGIEREAVLDLLSGLVSKSLVLVDTGGPSSRYRLLETIRQFGYEKLLDDSELERVRRCHLEYFVQLAAQAEPELRRREQAVWMDRLETELPNIRAADDWAAASRDAASAVRLAGLLHVFWFRRGYYVEAYGRYKRALAIPGAAEVPGIVRAEALVGAAQFARVHADFALAQSLLDESLALCSALGDRFWVGNTLLVLALVAQDSEGDFKAMRSFVDQALVLFEAIESPYGIALALVGKTHAAINENDMSAAELHAAHSLSIHRDLGDEWQIANMVHSQGELARRRGDYARARTCYEEAITLSRKLRQAWDHLAGNLQGLGYVALRQGDCDEARACFQESLQLLIEQGLRNKELFMAWR